jgi:hypothetical protein
VTQTVRSPTREESPRPRRAGAGELIWGTANRSRVEIWAAIGTAFLTGALAMVAIEVTARVRATLIILDLVSSGLVALGLVAYISWSTRHQVHGLLRRWAGAHDDLADRITGNRGAVLSVTNAVQRLAAEQASTTRELARLRGMSDGVLMKQADLLAAILHELQVVRERELRALVREQRASARRRRRGRGEVGIDSEVRQAARAIARRLMEE